MFAMFQSPIQYYPAYFHSFAMQLVKSWMDATKNHAVADAMVCLNFLARRRLRWSHASVRAASKTLVGSDREMISMVHWAVRPSASLTLFPALRLPAKAGARDKLRHHRQRYNAATGEILTISSSTSGAPSRSWMSAV